MPTENARLESRLRRLAKGRGYIVRKSRARMSGNNLGGFCLIDGARNFVLAGGDFSLSLEDLARELDREGA